jgi:hypothetical protein
MKNWKNDYCLLHFVGTDDMRPVMKNISRKGRYVYATNGSILAKVSRSKCMIDYPFVEKYPDADSVIDQIIPEVNTLFKTNELFEIIMKLKPILKHKEESCDWCAGTGKVDCHCCGHNSKCNDCAGTGQSTTSDLVLFSDDHFKVCGKLLSVENMSLLMMVAKYTGASKIQAYTMNDKYKGVLFIVGVFKILIMPKILPD